VSTSLSKCFRRADHDVDNRLNNRNPRGPQPSLHNLVLILRHDPGFAGRLSFDPRNSETLLDGAPLTDVGATSLNVDIGAAYSIDASTAVVVEAARFVGRDNRLPSDGGHLEETAQ